MNGTFPIPAYTLSIVVPVFDEEAVLPEFHRRLSAVLESLATRAEVIYVSGAAPTAASR